MCPENNFSCVADPGDDSQDIGVGSSKDIPPKKRDFKRTTAVVETEVRRSPRLNISTKGFKSSSCSDSKCLAYRTKPPTLKKETIQKIAIDFCNLNESEVNDNALQMKRARTHPVARARIVQAASVPPQEEQSRDDAATEGGERTPQDKE